jgi:hypothetical protein
LIHVLVLNAQYPTCIPKDLPLVLEFVAYTITGKWILDDLLLGNFEFEVKHLVLINEVV